MEVRDLLQRSSDHRRPRRIQHSYRLGLALSLSLSVSMQCPIIGQDSDQRDLTNVSLEDLMNIPITSVSKKEQKISKAGAAIYVLNQEDIRRSGATSIPDLLRFVPGVDVAKIDANTWAVSIRGFTSQYGNKVLVLIDGRSVYTPSFSGVFWDQQDVPLEDIERIEVIRGPGGTVWGANAVNGVINIITKGAKATRGGLVSVGTGSEETASAMMQYGGDLGGNGAYRVFGRYRNLDASTFPNGTAAADAWHMSHGGFRSDWDLSPRDALTLEGDVLHSDEGETLTAVFSNALPLQGTLNHPFDLTAGNVLGRWSHTLRNGSETSLQMYYDRYHRDSGGLPETVNTVDIDFQHHLQIGTRNDIVWGLGYRSTHFNDGVGNAINAITILPHHGTNNLFSVFLQDEIELTNALYFTLGSKFEHNPFTGFEREPGAQLVWTPTTRQTFWVSASKAIRQPSRVDDGMQVDISTFPLPQGGFGVVTLFGNPAATAEQLRDYETGYRAQVSKRLSLDLTTFLSYYRHLQTGEPLPSFFVAGPGLPHLVMPLEFDFKAHATDYGAEVAATWTATNHWKLVPTYSLLHMNVVRDASSGDTTVGQTPGYSPENQFSVRSFLDLPHNLQWDQTIGYVGGLRMGNVPGYTRLDTRLGWRIGESLEFSIVGQNLLRPLHAEFPDEFRLNHTEVERSVFGKLTWRF